MTDHKYENVKFRMDITNKFADALTRQANEAIRISARSSQELLNSKSKFNHPTLSRVVVERREKCDKTPNSMSNTCEVDLT